MSATSLKGVSKVGDSTISNDIRENLVSFFDWGLISKDGFVNVELTDSGVYGGNSSTLRLVDDPNYTAGRVWEGFRSNWVWESGVGTTSPLLSQDNSRPGVSGVYVDGTFYDTSTTGTYSHVIDHTNGRVIFNSAISTSSLVQCEYSYKYVNVVHADGISWFKEIQQNSERFDVDEFATTSGTYSQHPQNRLQLPAIGIEITSNRRMNGYQLGGGHYVYTDVLFHCVAEDSYMRDSLVDIINLQNQKTINLINMNSLADSGTFPLNVSGVPVSGALRYPDLTTNYPGGTLFMSNMGIDSIYSEGSVYVGTVKCTTEVVIGV